MNSQSAVMNLPRTRNLKLPARLVEQLTVDHAGPLQCARDAIEPFRFNVTPIRDGLQIEGNEVELTLAEKILEHIRDAVAKGDSGAEAMREAVFSAIDTCLKHDLAYRLEGLAHPVRPMSLNQVAFMQALLANEKALTVAIGPTGTGKTHLAIAAALNQLSLEHVKHVVITKPHLLMEGEVVTPAIRGDTEYDEQFVVFEDALRDLVGFHEYHRLVEEQKLEITPLGRMRGRTFNDAFIILDEAQNMTVRKMRMAVTRIGQHSRMVIMGDPTHADLPGGEPSGLAHLLSLVEDTDVALVHRFESNQIIRARIVARLEDLYARQTYDEQAAAA